MMRFLLGGVIAVSVAAAADAQTYQRPPQIVRDILDVPPPPSAVVSPTGEALLLVQGTRYPQIEELAKPYLRLAGLRIDPRTNGPARPSRVVGLKLVSLPPAGPPVDIDLPRHGRVGSLLWSPDGRRFAVLVTTAEGIELWTAEVATGPRLMRVPGVRINAAVGNPVQWMPGSTELLVQLVPSGRGEPPAPPAAPSGPIVQESRGPAAPVRTYPELLQTPHDEALFEYYATSQLALVDVKTHAVTPLGPPALVTYADPSPDGRYILCVRLTRPFSYLVPYTRFPHVVEVIDRRGAIALRVVERPLQDRIPIEGVPTGPRALGWVPTRPHTLLWVEAQDDGDPRKKVPHRDILYTAALGERPVELLRLEHRYAGCDFFPDGDRLLVRDYDRDRKWGRTFLVSTGPQGTVQSRVLFDRSVQDRYGNPGTPLTRVLPNGFRVLRTAGDPAGQTLWLAGSGAGPQGDRPFLDRYDLATGRSERIFHCGEGVYEEVVAVLDDTGSRLLIRRESPTQPPNLYYREQREGRPHEQPLTAVADPWPELRAARKELLTTRRDDGTSITIQLYLPPGRRDGEKLPAVFYAYPVEFVSADTAGQVSGSPHRFTVIGGYSHLFFLTQGYAVMEVSMPVVGPPETANDTFVEQLVATARAALEKVKDYGVDTGRVGVLGHSYGAFMAANLLAHSDLFRAGIARSGAYNRTLTPFGFQNERRTFWEAPATYAKVSPFFHADKIKEPLLLIHGQADNNPGTFPMQSERMYAAVRAHGGTVRLVLLPHESHGYEARESVEHVLYEQFAWFDRYVKGAKP